MPEVTVVVPTWNRRELLERLLACIREQTVSASEVVVVDNGSTDDSCAVAQASGARVVALGRNEGFSVAVNRGIRESRTELVAIVNNDVEPDRDWLERLLCALERNPSAWFVTGKLLDAARPSVVDGTFDAICRGGCAWRVGNGRPDGPLWSQARPIRMASFTAALFRAELFRRVGALDSRFDSYLEDTDFGIRCARAGYPGWYEPDAVARHRGSATLGAWSPAAVRLIARNQVYLLANHYSRSDLVRNGWHILVAHCLWGGVAARRGCLGAFLRGKLEGLVAFRTLRRSRQPRPGELQPILEDGEREILALQRRTRFDAFWKAYFKLT